MSDIKITTDNKPRPVIDAWELTAKERAEFDYLNWPAIDEGTDSASFMRYKGRLYCLGGEFVRTPEGGELARAGWQGMHADSAFSGILMRYADESGEEVIAGWYMC